MYSQLFCCSSVNPWYIVEAGACIGVVGINGGAGVVAGYGVCVVGTDGADSRPVVGCTAGVRRGFYTWVVAAGIASWRARISSADSNTSSSSVSISSESAPASCAGVGGAGSLPLFDATGVGRGGGCAGLLEEGLLTSSSPSRPTGLVGSLFARLIILGSDEEGAGAAKETLRPSLGFRVGRGSSFAGPGV
jgi:hypothetical protein